MNKQQPNKQQPNKQQRKARYQAEDEAAERYLRAYLAAAGPRLAWLRDQDGADEGPLDSSRTVVPELVLGGHPVPAPPPDAPMEFVVADARNADNLPRNADLPMWFGRTALQAPAHWDDESLAVIDALGVLPRRVPAPGGAGEPLGGRPRRRTDLGQRVSAGADRLPARGRVPADRADRRVLILMSPVYRTFRPDLPDNGERPTPEDLRDCFDTIMTFREARS